jgi:hypothetical protein
LPEVDVAIVALAGAETAIATAAARALSFHFILDLLS